MHIPSAVDNCMDHETFVFYSVNNEIGMYEEEQNIVRSQVFATVSKPCIRREAAKGCSHVKLHLQRDGRTCILKQIAQYASQV